jgi:hypothetical protein
MYQVLFYSYVEKIAYFANKSERFNVVVSLNSDNMRKNLTQYFLDIPVKGGKRWQRVNQN